MPRFKELAMRTFEKVTDPSSLDKVARVAGGVAAIATVSSEVIRHFHDRDPKDTTAMARVVSLGVVATGVRGLTEAIDGMRTPQLAPSDEPAPDPTDPAEVLEA